MSGGKNIAPAPLEKVMDAHPLIDYAMVVGEGRPYVGALISVDTLMLPDWLERHGKDRATPVLLWLTAAVLALLGKKAGEEVVVEAPAGNIHYQILEIQR